MTLPLPGATPSEPKPGAMPATVGGMVDEAMVIVEDVLEDKDDEEDAARSGRPSSSSLSAHAPPFFPARRLAGASSGVGRMNPVRVAPTTNSPLLPRARRTWTLLARLSGPCL